MKTVNKINQYFSFQKNLLLVTSFIALAGCTQDKSLDQFRQQQANEYAAQYNAVVANYTGAVVSKQGNSKLGSITLQIESGKQVQNSSDGLGNETKAVLTGHLVYNGLTQATIAFTQGIIIRRMELSMCWFL
jgi:flagellar biosynthesis/type III secretory pathway ATPase